MAHILIIDDSNTEASAFSRILEKHGHQTSISGSAFDGITRARSEQPDLILMDVIMPGMNGFQATRRLSRDTETTNIPVLIVTSKDQETDRIWGLRQGARDYLVKPVKEAELLDKIASLTVTS